MDTFICLSNELPLELCKVVMDKICVVNITNTLSELDYDGNDFIKNLYGLGCCLVGQIVMDCFLNETSKIKTTTISIAGKLNIASQKYPNFKDSEWKGELIHPFEEIFSTVYNRQDYHKLNNGLISGYERIYIANKNVIHFYGINEEWNDLISAYIYFDVHNIYFDGTNLEYPNLSTIITKKISMTNVIESLLNYFNSRNCEYNELLSLLCFDATFDQIQEAIQELLYDYSISIFGLRFESIINDICNSYGLNKYKLVRSLCYKDNGGILSKYNLKLSVKTKIKWHILDQCMYLYDKTFKPHTSFRYRLQSFVTHVKTHSLIADITTRIFETGCNLFEYRERGFVIEY